MIPIRKITSTAGYWLRRMLLLIRRLEHRFSASYIRGMDAYSLLRAQAKEKYKATMQVAREEYHNTLKEIVSLRLRIHKRSVRSLAVGGKTLRRKRVTVAYAAEAILKECGQLTLAELTIEVQARGFRTGDDPRAVAHAIRGAFTYHRNRFQKDKAGRWSVVSGNGDGNL